MGNILSSTVLENNKIRFKVLLNEKEAATLKGSMNKIHIFSEDLSLEETRMIEKGSKGSTKYFSLPKKFRRSRKKNSKNNLSQKILCQKIDSGNKIIFIYTINKTEEII